MKTVHGAKHFRLAASSGSKRVGIPNELHLVRSFRGSTGNGFLAHKLWNGAIGEGEVAQKNTPMILGAMVQHRRDERDPENPIPVPNQVHETRALIVH